ncbi:unnamed protein product [Ilex paraguariensis]|uniref:Thioredoxin domain-containing protein n=1 Tax=Ilex paraguariensis TaxID=185542 RepID=A0ABC8T6Q9_9AQUA
MPDLNRNSILGLNVVGLYSSPQARSALCPKLQLNHLIGGVISGFGQPTASSGGRTEYREKLLVVKIDHDSNPRLIEEYKVYGLPALILFQNGLEVPNSRTEGALTIVKLKEYLDALLESVSIA